MLTPIMVRCELKKELRQKERISAIEDAAGKILTMTVLPGDTR